MNEANILFQNMLMLVLVLLSFEVDRYDGFFLF